MPEYTISCKQIPSSNPGILQTEITLSKEGIPYTRTIMHYHVPRWQDTCGVDPKVVATLVELLSHETMPVIHCSAGIGRGGTTALTYGAYLDDRTDLKNALTSLREERRGCVQTLSQYITAHQSLKLLLEKKAKKDAGKIAAEEANSSMEIDSSSESESDNDLRSSKIFRKCMSNSK